MLKRMIIHVLGLILISFGIALIMSQNSGIFPWDAAGLNLVSLFAKWHIKINVGIASFILNSILGILCIIFTRDLKYLFSFINIAIFSLFLNLSTWLLGYATWSESVPMVLSMLCLGLLSIAIGTNFNVISKLVASPVEALLMIVHRKWFPRSLGLSKAVLETTFLCVAIVLGALNGHALAHITWFTFVAVAVLSPLIQVTHKPIKLLYGGFKNEVK